MISRKPPLAAICGVKNSGKTTCLEGLVTELSQMGYRVAVIKHDGHDFEGDVPGTDSWRMYQAGAWGTAVCSDYQILIHKRQTESGKLWKQLEVLTESFLDADLILVEGMKALPIPKVEIIRAGISKIPVSNPEGRIGIVTNVTQDREEFARITGYELEDQENLYELDKPGELAKQLAALLLYAGKRSSLLDSQGGYKDGKDRCSMHQPPEGDPENQCT